jgi:hypothetical protein
MLKKQQSGNNMYKEDISTDLEVIKELCRIYENGVARSSMKPSL